MIIQAVCILLGVKPDKKTVQGVKSVDYWTPAKTKLMTQPKQFLSKLLEFAKKEKKNIANRKIKQFAKEIIPHPDFNEIRAKTLGNAIAGFFYFCSAMYNFKVVYDKTEPLREKLRV